MLRNLKYLNKIDAYWIILIHSSERLVDLVDCKCAWTFDAALYLHQPDFASLIPARAAVCQENVYAHFLAFHQAFWGVDSHDGNLPGSTATRNPRRAETNQGNPGLGDIGGLCSVCIIAKKHVYRQRSCMVASKLSTCQHLQTLGGSWSILTYHDISEAWLWSRCQACIQLAQISVISFLSIRGKLASDSTDKHSLHC